MSLFAIKRVSIVKNLIVKKLANDFQKII